jgi:hypothetical protein
MFSGAFLTSHVFTEDVDESILVRTVEFLP